MGELAKKVIAGEGWEKKLSDNKIRKEDMNTLVMNFLVTEGYDLVAGVFHKESGTKHIDLEKMSTGAATRRAIHCGKLENAIEILGNSYLEVLNAHRELVFLLQKQRLIELIRTESVEEALDFCHEYVAPLCEANPDLLNKMERTVSLLAFENPSSCPIGELMDRSQVLKIAHEVNQAILTSEGHKKDPKLSEFLKKLMFVQNELVQEVTFPCVDLSSGILKDPATSEE